MIQYITRKFEADASHRVMNERMKCFNCHGHRYSVYLTFSFEQIEEIGYAIDFKEIKRVGGQWIEDTLDHGAIYNPTDVDFIFPCFKHKTKVWLMSLNGDGNYCNPSVENIAKEIFLAMKCLFKGYEKLKIYKVVVYETENCSTECFGTSEKEESNWNEVNWTKVREYALNKGIIEYDDRKIK